MLKVCFDLILFDSLCTERLPTFHRIYLSLLDDDGDECYSENSDESGKLNICYQDYTYGTTNLNVLARILLPRMS